MNRRWLLGLVLLLLACPLWAQQPSSMALIDLQREARQFEVFLQPLAPAPAEGLHLRTWLDLADELAAGGRHQCLAAYALLSKALRLGLTQDFSAWLGLSRAALCGARYAEASQALWLALQQPSSVDQQIQAGGLMVDALGRRNGGQQDWFEVIQHYTQKVLALDPDNPIADLLHGRQGGALPGASGQIAPLVFTGVSPRQEGRGLSLCLNFRQSLYDSEIPEGVESFVRFEPDIGTEIRRRGNQLCASGADFGVAYGLTLRAGLQIGNYRLQETLQEQIPAIDRDPRLWFNASAYVLPLANQGLVPLHSLNLEQAQVRLYRIHERNILSPFVQQRFRRPLQADDLRQVADQVGELVWQEQLALANERNQSQETALQLPQELLQRPGLYVLHAVDQRLLEEDYWATEDAYASQWLVVSDIGLTSYLGQDGLSVQARSLASGEPLPGLQLSLNSQNNRRLASLTTDAQGLVRFDPGLLRGTGGRQARQLVAFSPQLGFSLLDLDKAPLDLSDRGVAGRAAPTGLDAYVFTEQGIYRPGDRVHVTALVRDRLGQKGQALPLVLRLFNPQGEPLMERLVQPSPQAAYLSSLDLPTSARSGKWRLALFAGAETQALGESGFWVESIVPPRIEARLEVAQGLERDQPAQARLEVSYLYGAPAADLRVKAEVNLVADGNPFAAYSGFHFGDQAAEDQAAASLDRMELAQTRTDAQGRALIPLRLEPHGDWKRPLRARLKVSVIDVDGRALDRHASFSLRHLPLYLGIRPAFADRRAEGHGSARFQLISLDRQGRPLANQALSWRLIAEQADYQWYRRDGRWQYDRVVYDTPLTSGEIDTDDSGMAELAVAVEQGDYRLQLTDAEQRVISSLRFKAGDQVLGESETPDSVRLSLDKSEYRAGEQARLRVQGPFPGKASLVIANERILSMREFDLGSEEQQLNIAVEPDWGAGAYALVTLYRPAQGQQQARRALGLIWLDLSDAPHRLALELGQSGQVRPRQRVEVPLRIPGLQPGEEVELTLAAVDEAVLQLTGFSPPDPLAHYFGKRQLGLILRDLYGNLIPLPHPRPGQQRQGGGDAGDTGAAGLEGAPVSDIRLVSHFSGLVRLGPQGEALIPLDLPDFNGRLRLMAVAWSDKRLGSATGVLQVSDPLVVTPALPRFLGPGDRARMTLSLDNLEAPAGTYQIELQGDGVVEVAGGGQRSIRLDRQGRVRLGFELRAHRLGSAQLQLRLSGPQGYSYQRQLRLEVRGHHFPLTRRSYQRLQPGEQLRLDQTDLAGLYPETARLTLGLSASPAVDVPGLLDQLERYPYGCLEQLVSRAFPLLYANPLAARWGGRQDQLLEHRLQGAIYDILEKQDLSGGFVLWNADDNRATEGWLSAYALEFLWRAAEQGYAVPASALKRGQRWLSSQVRRGYYAHDADARALEVVSQAYAHYVLALMGQGRAEDLRYLIAQHKSSMRTPLALGQAATALALMGDAEAASGLMQEAMASSERGLRSEDYGSLLRDQAALIYLLQESRLAGLDPAQLWARLLDGQQASPWLSTQEQAWLVLAASTLDGAQEMRVQQDQGEVRRHSQPLHLQPDPARLQAGMGLTNRGERPIWVVQQVHGTPIQEVPLAQPAFRLQRAWFRPNGELADPAQVNQGDSLVLLIQGEARRRGEHRLLLVDLLPAGFELELGSFSEGATQGDYAWLPKLSPLEFLDRRDDRMVMALDLKGRDQGKFSLAYQVRAVTPGRYLWPGSVLEDMYRPDLRGQTQARPVEVLGAAAVGP
ncbi:MAG: alpha-2-macroglobulin family protein [Gammaproteobacteria bacterium SHHR-1]